MNFKTTVYVPGLDIEVPIMEWICWIFLENPKYYGLMVAIGGALILIGAILMRGNNSVQRSDIFSMLVCKPFKWSGFFMLLGIVCLAVGIFLLIIL